MYILISFIHLLFIIWAHLLSFYILEGIFIFLFAFFFLYFSPIFFSKDTFHFSHFTLDSLSPKNSITFPLLLLYGALYIFLFALVWDLKLTFNIGIYVIIGGFLLFFGYMMMTDWKHDIFFDVTRIHLIIAYIVGGIIIIFSLFSPGFITLEILSLLCISLLFSYFFFKVSREESPLFFQAGLLAIIGFFYSIWNYMTGDMRVGILLSIIAGVSIFLFECMPKYRYFSQFLVESKMMILLLIMISSVWLMWLSIWDFSFFPSIIIILIFLLWVHIRFSNYIALFLGIFSLFFLYGNTFFSLITPNSLFSSLLFVFFLPLCIIGSTYFWDEKYPYDFSFLHYTSIAFSSIFSLYCILFIGWWPNLFFVISGCIFATWILFLFSYFRFRYR